MPLFRPAPPRRSLLVVLASAVLVPMFVPAVAAAAGDQPSSGDRVVGELVQAWPEHKNPDEAVARADAGPLSWIETASGDAVRVSTEDLARKLPGTDVPVGATVSVVVGGEAAHDPAAGAGLDPALQVLSAAVVTAAPAEAPLAAAVPTDEVTVVMMIPAGGAPEAGRTLAQVEAAVNGPVADFWSEQSGGTIRVTTAAGNDPAWVQATADCSDPYGLWTEAAAHAHWTSGAGKHLLVYLPRASSGCAYGLAQIGSSVTAGGKLYVTDVATSVIAHELGHNFGLGHSSGYQCDASVERGSCRTVAYRDYYDVMGVSWEQVGSLNAVQAARIGLLPGAQQESVTVTTPGTTYALAPISGLTGTRALRVADPSGAVYWLEYRPPTGRDAWLASTTLNRPRLESGVLLRRAGTGPNDSSLLLDGTPSASAGWDADMQTALPLNTPVRVEGGGFTVTVLGVAPGEATVLVERSPDPLPPFPRDWNGDAGADLLSVDARGAMTLFPGAPGGGFGTPSLIGSGWQALDLILMAGDWDGDRRRDVIARDRANGDLWLYPGDAAGRWRGGAHVIGRGWQGMDTVLSPGDWDGDGYPDLLARRRADGALFMYRGNGSGGWLGGTQVGSGWQVMTALAVGGDWNGDGLVDLIARDRSGLLWLYPSSGHGGFGAPRIIGSGWQGFVQLVSPGDWDGDGAPDLLATTADGSLLLYRGNGAGGWRGQSRIGSGWTGLRLGR